MNKEKLKYHSHINVGRRRFIKQSAALTSATMVGLPTVGVASGIIRNEAFGKKTLALSRSGFNGERKDPVTGNYHLGNGYRMYNPRLMRFHAADSMSPFGRGGVNSYAYTLGDPVNRSDPSGHFAVFSLLIGAIVGAVVGAGISAAAEGIRAATTGDSFDWKQVGIGAALGFISGGFGAAAQGAKTGVQFGLALGDAVVSGAADYGLNIAAGAPAKQAGINAGVGAVVGLATFGIGQGIGAYKVFTRRGGEQGAIIAKGTKSIKMKELHKFGTDADSQMYFFKDVYKGEPRINISTHGYLRWYRQSKRFQVTMSSKLYSAKKIHTMLSEAYPDYDTINHIRVAACNSGSKVWENSTGVYTSATSFIEKLAKISKKTVKGYDSGIYVVDPFLRNAKEGSSFTLFKGKGRQNNPIVAYP